MIAKYFVMAGINIQKKSYNLSRFMLFYRDSNNYIHAKFIPERIYERQPHSTNPISLLLSPYH
jgi:hypothetical protein